MTCVQIVFFTSFTLGMSGHYANIFIVGDESAWLALVDTRTLGLVGQYANVFYPVNEP